MPSDSCLNLLSWLTSCITSIFTVQYFPSELSPPLPALPTFVCTVREVIPKPTLWARSVPPRSLGAFVFSAAVLDSWNNPASLCSFPHGSQDDSTSHSDHQDPISLAVEMAAVNHTILALARQGANEIKTEALDDDWCQGRGGSKREVT